MKLAFGLGLLWASILIAAAQPSLARLERISLFGHEYIRLEDWARANRGQTKWITPKRQVQISLPGWTLVASADARKISLNGVYVWLSTPIVMRNNSALIAPIDLTSSIQPLLAPSRNVGGKRVRTIVLDPGHGGRDPGKTDGKQQEKKYTLLFASDLGGILKQAGFNVSYTRSSDCAVDLSVRPDIAKRLGADLFISLHFNSADGPGGSAVKGAEVYCMTPAHTSSTNDRLGVGSHSGSYPGNRFDSKNMLLAYQIQKSLVRSAGTEDRGVHHARYEVLREAEMPAVLIESAFMTNPSDSKRIYDAAGRRRLAQAIADGVVAYKKLVEP